MKNLQVNDIAKKAVEIFKRDHHCFIHSLKKNEWWSNYSVDEQIFNLVAVFLKHDQGSLSFTMTALKHRGYKEQAFVWEVIEEARNLYDRNN